jgi:hypothetical protein
MPEQQVFGKTIVVWFPRNTGVPKKCLDFRCKCQLACCGIEPVIERLDAESIARNEQPLLTDIPDGKSEHAAQPCGHRFAPLLVPVDDNFGIRSRPERVTTSDELGAQLGKVIDFAVEDYADRLVFVEHWLSAAGDVNDCEPPMPQAAMCSVPETLPVGTPVRDSVRHCAHRHFRFR